MGWQRLEFTNDTILVWHNGAIDGTSYMAFLPQHDLDIVVLNNMNFAPTGIGFYIYMVTLLLNQRFGLNHDVTEKAPSSATPVSTGCGSLGRRATNVDWKAVAPFLGYYADGYSLTARAATS